MEQFYVYVMASKKNGVLYIGSTSNLIKRVHEHKNNFIKGFTQKYFIHRLVYFEICNNPEIMVQRERHMKKWNREWKVKLIEKNNPDWSDLYENIL